MPCFRRRPVSRDCSSIVLGHLPRKGSSCQKYAGGAEPQQFAGPQRASRWRRTRRSHVNRQNVRRACKPRRKRSAGAALVELAIVLVLLVTLVLGCIDFGRFASTLIAVNNAAREGASFGSTHLFTPNTQQRWKDKIKATVIDELAGLPNFSAESVQVGEPTMLAEAVDETLKLRVQVDVAHQFETIVPWPLLPNSVQISRSAVMPVVR